MFPRLVIVIVIVIVYFANNMKTYTNIISKHQEIIKCVAG